MPFNLDKMLVVAITSRALFDLHDSDQVYREQGLDAYRAHQLNHEDEPLSPGTGFPLVRGLLGINERIDTQLVEVVILSRNDGDSGLRLMNSIEHHGLDITRAAFRGGQDPLAYLPAFRVDLFLSAEPEVVEEALRRGVASAYVLDPPEALDAGKVEQVRVAFDGDAVLFGDESERYYRTHDLDAFQAREAELADQPMDPGPFKSFLVALAGIQAQFSERESPIRTALVTARNAPAHKRVIKTLREWNVHVDEAVFLGGVEKTDVLVAMKPHIFFDDQMTHLEKSRLLVPSAHVIPYDHGEQEQLFDTPTPKQPGADASPVESQDKDIAS